MAVKQDHGGSTRIHENLRDEKTQELRGRSVSNMHLMGHECVQKERERERGAQCTMGNPPIV